MKSAKIEKFLIANGYKLGSLTRINSPTTCALYYRINYDRNSPFCLLNDKPPQFVVNEFFLSKVDAPGLIEDLRRFSVGITNESPFGWLDFKFYDLSEKELIKKLPALETALLAAWKQMFEPQKI